jgi:PAS domain S-box-containing protein
LVTGYSRSEICQMNMRRLVTPEHQEQLDQLLTGHRNGETRSHCDLEIMTKTGRHVCLDVNTRLDYREGKAVGIRGIARDITERRQSEEALRQSEYQLRLSLRERQRIGEDLHDDIIQSIYAVGLGIEECRWQLTREPDRVDEQLEHAQTELNRVIQDVRGFIVGLESEVLDGQGFYEALNSLVRIMTHSQSGRFILQAEPAALECLKPLQATHLVHIAREAMSNSLRHAKATETRVTFRACNGSVRLEIKDNGVGFDLATRKASGHGLRNLATRAQELEAELDIQSQAGQGTRVLLILPQN